MIGNKSRRSFVTDLRGAQTAQRIMEGQGGRKIMILPMGNCKIDGKPAFLVRIF